MFEPFDAFLEKEIEAVTVLVLEEYILTPIPTEYHVVECTGVM